MKREKSGASGWMMIVLLVFIALLVAAGSSLPPTAIAVVIPDGQGGGRPTATPTPKPTPPKRTTPRPSPRSTPQPTTQTTPRPAATPAPRRAAPQIEMVQIPAGTFQMGSPASETGHKSDEAPVHRVTVPGFSLGKYEVTQAQYQAVMGVNPSSFKGADRPVENVTWTEAVEFCRQLSQLTGQQYRLPTEAEWEYACRAGTTTPFAYGSSLSSAQANFYGTYPYGGAAVGVNREQTTPVGSFAPNPFGLYDMHGNVFEWCQDLYHDNYSGAPTDGSAWESGAQPERVLRGGSWYMVAANLRSADRFKLLPDGRGNNYGFRVALSAK